MPRGRKRVIPIEDEIDSVCKNIETLEKRLNSQRATLKKLTDRKRESDISELMRIIDKNNLSIRGIIEEISPRKNSTIEEEDNEDSPY